MRIIVCSIPKSGTHLAGRILRELGVGDSGLHLKRGSYTDYNRAEGDVLRSRAEEGLEEDVPIEESLALVPDGCFAVSHLSPVRAPLLRENGFRILHTRRDLRDVVVSFARWTRDTGRWGKGAPEPWRKLDGPEMLMGFLRARDSDIRRSLVRTAAWAEPQADAIVTFEDLTGANGSAPQMAAVGLIADVAGRGGTDAGAIVRACLGEATLTWSGSTTRREDYWSDGAERWFRKRPSPLKPSLRAINRSLGYE